MGPQWDYNLSPVHELAFRDPFPMEGYLAQPRNKEEDLGAASRDVTDFVNSPWETSPSLRSGWRVGRREVGRCGKTGKRGSWA